MGIFGRHLVSSEPDPAHTREIEFENHQDAVKAARMLARATGQPHYVVTGEYWGATFDLPAEWHPQSTQKITPAP